MRCIICMMCRRDVYDVYDVGCGMCDVPRHFALSTVDETNHTGSACDRRSSSRSSTTSERVRLGRPAKATINKGNGV